MKGRKHITHHKPAHKKQAHQQPLFIGRLIVPMFLTISVFVTAYLVVNGIGFFSLANSPVWMDNPFIKFKRVPTVYPPIEESTGCIKCGFGCLPAREQAKVNCPQVIDDSFRCASVISSDGTTYCQAVPNDRGSTGNLSSGDDAQAVDR